jgi:hypothetical protein
MLIKVLLEVHKSIIQLQLSLLIIMPLIIPCLPKNRRLFKNILLAQLLEVEDTKKIDHLVRMVVLNPQRLCLQET